jgi:hypothetical protein
VVGGVEDIGENIIMDGIIEENQEHIVVALLLMNK